MAKEPWNDINSPGFGFFNEKEEQRKREEERRQAEEDMRAADAADAAARRQQFKADMYDPRWYHKDPQRAEESPDTVHFGDTIILEIKSKGIVNGAGVDIEVIDNNASASWNAKRKLRSRVKNDTLSVEWTVEKGKNDSDEPDYGFSGSYSGYSGSASVRNTPITLEKLEELVFELSM